MEKQARQETQRLASLDALRGFDMLWITGGQKIVFALATVTGLPSLQWLNTQMHHVEWNGFAFYDMIFPLFLFLSGVSMPFSFSKRLEKGESKNRIYLHALKRMLLLVLFGMIYNGVFHSSFNEMRFASVLGRIGIAWFLAALIYLNTSLRGQIIWFWAILVSYCLAMLFIPVPGFGAGVLTPEGNLSGYIDRLILPGKLYIENTMEAEGILSTIPAISTALLGVFAGHFLKISDEKIDRIKKSIILIVSGMAFLIIGMAWSTFFPINKMLWTSSFVLFVGGLSLMLLGVFYFIIDALNYKKWSFFFTVIGLNSITIYLVQYKIIDFNKVRDFLFGTLINSMPEFIKPVLSQSIYVFLIWAFLYFLYKNKIFLKI